MYQLKLKKFKLKKDPLFMDQEYPNLYRDAEGYIVYSLLDPLPRGHMLKIMSNYYIDNLTYQFYIRYTD
jgi:hypothetical protein